MKTPTHCVVAASLLGLLGPLVFAQDEIVLPDAPVMISIDSASGVDVMVMPDGTTKEIGPVAPGGGMVNLNSGKVAGGVVTKSVDVAQLRQRMVDSLKQSLGVNDDEWAVLVPRMMSIQALRSALGDNRGSGAKLGMLSTSTTADAGSKPSATISEMVAEYRAKSQALRKAAGAAATAEPELLRLLSAARDMEQRLRAQLLTERKALVELVTRRQEAVLYEMGVLD